MYTEILVSGFIGGLVRGLIGFVKHQYAYKSVGFNPSYFFGMSFLSGAIGFVTALVAKGLGITFLGGSFSPAMAFVIGYAGGDFIENIFKIIIKQPSLYSFPDNTEKRK